jgi:SAM-dependent methyltransferase
VGNFVNNDYDFKKCPICGYKKFVKFGVIKKSQQHHFSSNLVKLGYDSIIFECLYCKSLFKQHIINPYESRELYSMGSSIKRWASKSFTEEKTGDLSNSISKLFKPCLSVLDIGCGSGSLLDFAKLNKCITSGVEFSKESRKILLKKNHKMYSSMKSVRGKFDIIFAFDLVEHLYDLQSFISFCEKHLVFGGKLVILTGDISCFSSKIMGEKWGYFKYPEHIIFPNKLFFNKLDSFEVVLLKNIFNSKEHKRNIFYRVLTIFKLLISKKYFGVPSITPDHFLLILEKRKKS